MNNKVKVARLSIYSNTVLILLKLIVGLISGSVSIISEAIHSTMDLVAAVIAFFSVKASDKPADEKHPYGHGKYENVSGIIEALLIFIAAIWIIVESVKKLLSPKEVASIGLGSGLLLIWVTGRNSLDPIVAILVAIFILKWSTINVLYSYTIINQSL